MRSNLLLGALILALGIGGAQAQWDFFNGVVYGMASSLGMSPGVTNDALLMARAASCELSGIGCVGQIVVDPLSVESRLELECVDATEDDVAQDHGRCYDKLWDGAIYENLFSRARASDSPYLASKGDYRWVSQITWSGPQAAYQSYEGLQLDAAWGYWKTRDYPLWDCGAGSSKGCRRASICKMTERGFGRVQGIQGASLINLQDTDDRVFKFPDGKSAGFGSRVTGSCMACLTVPCEPYWCMNGRVPGYALRSEPLLMNKVMERWPCERSCSAGTFLTCSQASACWYKPATDHELGSGAAGLREWYGYNAFTNKSGANLVQWEKRGPPVEECYPCVDAYRRMHFGVFADTDRTLFNKGFLEFTCPGGAQGPLDCPLNMVSRVDAATGRSGSCGCRPGYYWVQDKGACQPCPAGHFCAWDGVNPPGAPVECPNDTYSTGGAEVCTKCSTSRQCDAGQALRRCLQNGAAGESGKFQREDSECVPCFQCTQLGSGEDQVPCFKVSSLKAV
jgi:hypothetical protein